MQRTPQWCIFCGLTYPRRALLVPPGLRLRRRGCQSGL
ncbi:hypothetical protein IEO21_10377 [Rhodonia placenta]|uniref:Uncharacterized protein n=1 Tax=Rhodonia placenta TaxID=104341 RepID=A0A8H7NSP6_9APHY|nr:hypothetical protein IEO21_10377 [Postia placenta]